MNEQQLTDFLFCLEAKNANQLVSQIKTLDNHLINFKRAM